MGFLKKQPFSRWQETKKVFIRQETSWTPNRGLQVISRYHVYFKDRVTGEVKVEQKNETNVAIHL